MSRLFKRLQRDGFYITVFKVIRFCFVIISEIDKGFKVSTLKQRYIEKNIMGNTMILDREDYGLSRDLIAYGIREPFLVDLMKNEIKIGDTVVKIGANIGYYALQASKLVGNSGKVYAIEPVTQTYKLLRKNIELNGCKNIEAYSMAIGNKFSEVCINIPKQRNWAAITDVRDQYIDKQSVQVTLLDVFLYDKRMPDLISMDVEGYELEILEGMNRLLNLGKPLKIVMELHIHYLGKGKTIEALEILKHAGFEIKTAIIEPLPMLCRFKFLRNLMNHFILENTGYRIGYNYFTIDDMLNNDKLLSGQIEAMEILFVR